MHGKLCKETTTHVYLCNIPTDHHQLLILTLYKNIYKITFMLTVLFFLVSNKIK